MKDREFRREQKNLHKAAAKIVAVHDCHGIYEVQLYADLYGLPWPRVIVRIRAANPEQAYNLALAHPYTRQNYCSDAVVLCQVDLHRQPKAPLLRAPKGRKGVEPCTP